MRYEGKFITDNSKKSQFIIVTRFSELWRFKNSENQRVYYHRIKITDLFEAIQFCFRGIRTEAH